MLDTHLYLGPRLRLSGALPLFLIYAFLTWTTGRSLAFFFTEVSVYRNFNSHSIKMFVSNQYTLRNEIRLFTSQTVLIRNFTLWVGPALRERRPIFPAGFAFIENIILSLKSKKNN
jgi:hypothetical protein